MHLLGKLSYCSIWHLNLSQESLLSPAWKRRSSTQQSDSLSKVLPGRFLSQPTVTGQCPSNPPRHKHLSVCYYLVLHTVRRVPIHLHHSYSSFVAFRWVQQHSKHEINVWRRKGKTFNKTIFDRIVRNPHQGSQAGRILLERLGNMAD